MVKYPSRKEPNGCRIHGNRCDDIDCRIGSTNIRGRIISYRADDSFINCIWVGCGNISG